MTPERWARVKELFHAALELPPADREAFLAERCADDTAPGELRAELDRLLASLVQADTFIEQSPVAGPGGSSLLHLAVAPLTGRVIGRYEVGRLLGTGGMGQVYAATDRELGRTVAIKMAFGSDEESRARLRREAQHASQLNHPHICTIHEVGAIDGQPFIVMELVEGLRLSEVIPADGLPVEDVVRYGRQVADALAHAHRAGVTHGDLKGANVIVTPEGRVKVLDFGLARRSAQEVQDLSQSRAPTTDEGQLAGTLSWMAPELLRGEPSDPRSDVWALGVLMHQMTAGAQPFAGATGFELSGAILHQPPAPLPARVPTSLGAVIQRCLLKQPDDRYPQAGDVQTALDALDLAGTRSNSGTGLLPSAPAWPRIGGWLRRAALALTVIAVAYSAYRAGRPTTDAAATAGASARPRGDVSTSSPEALRLYTEGIDARANFRFLDAEKLLTQAVAIDPDFGEAYLELAFAADTRGARDQGRAYLDQAAEHAARLGDRGRLLLRLELARADRKFVEAAEALDQLVAAYPDVEPAYSIAVSLYHPVTGPLANEDKMLAVTQGGVNALPSSPMTRNVYANALFTAGRYVDALREFEAYARLAPRELEPLIGLSTTYLMMGLPEKAIDASGQALQIDPTFAAARGARAAAFALLGRYDEAIAESAPERGSRMLYLSGAGRIREAQRLSTESIRQAESSQNPTAVTATNLLGCRLAVNRRDYEGALESCRAAAGSATQLPAEPRRLNLVIAEAMSGVTRARLGQFDDAAVLLASVARAHRPTSPLEHWLHEALKGEIALARGELQKAERAFKDGEPAVRAFGYGSTGMANNPPFTDGLARVAEAKGDRQGAIDLYRRLLTQGPEHKWLALFEPRYLLRIGRLLEQSGERQAARQEYERFLAIWHGADAGLPELAEARSALARLR